MELNKTGHKKKLTAVFGGFFVLFFLMCWHGMEHQTFIDKGIVLGEYSN